MQELSYPRRRTRAVRVGNITIGGGHPVVVQSMITEETRNVAACVAQIIAMHEAGCEIVRVTTPTLAEAHCLGEIQAEVRRRGYDVPLVADVHHQGSDIAVAVARFVDKVRINPGLFVFRKPRQRTDEYTEAEVQEELFAIEESLLPVIEVCKERDIAMRIGVNHGSLAERLTVMHGDTPQGMVESALEYIRICEAHGYKNLVISLKASRVPVMLAANRLMAWRMDEAGMDYPLHLGVTEAGDGEYARIKSTAGIGTLLAEGIGDTIRVSLAEDPINELPGLLRHPASPGPAQDQGGVHRVSVLWAHQVRVDLRSAAGEGGDAAPSRAGHRRDGLHRQRAGRDGRRRLRVRRQGWRRYHPVPGPHARQERPAGARRGRTDRADPGRRTLDRPAHRRPVGHVRAGAGRAGLTMVAKNPF